MKSFLIRFLWFVLANILKYIKKFDPTLCLGVFMMVFFASIFYTWHGSKSLAKVFLYSVDRFNVYRTFESIFPFVHLWNQFFATFLPISPQRTVLLISLSCSIIRINPVPIFQFSISRIYSSSIGYGLSFDSA